jgi:hypothetical protein
MRWLANGLQPDSDIAARGRQERKWLAAVAYARKCPDQLINDVDQVALDGFPEEGLAAFCEDRCLFDKSVPIALLFLRSENDYTISKRLDNRQDSTLCFCKDCGRKYSRRT